MNEAIQTAFDQVNGIVSVYGLRVVGAVAILLIGLLLARWSGRATERALRAVSVVDETLRSFFASLVRYGVVVVTVLAVLDRFGVETTSLIAVLGAASLAVGLALQGTLSNVAAGVMLLIFRPFRVGHYIEVNGIAGTVKAVSLFVTDLATPDNVQVVVPNAELWNKALKNYSENATRRVDLAVGIGYGDDIGKAMAIVLRLAREDSRVLNDPEPFVAVENLGESSVDLVIRLWCDSANYWPLKFDMTRAIKEAFDRAGVTIPYPQRDVHVSSREGAIARAVRGRNTVRTKVRARRPGGKRVRVTRKARK